MNNELLLLPEPRAAIYTGNMSSLESPAASPDIVSTDIERPGKPPLQRRRRWLLASLVVALLLADLAVRPRGESASTDWYDRMWPVVTLFFAQCHLGLVWLLLGQGLWLGRLAWCLAALGIWSLLEGESGWIPDLSLILPLFAAPLLLLARMLGLRIDRADASRDDGPRRQFSLAALVGVFLIAPLALAAVAWLTNHGGILFELSYNLPLLGLGASLGIQALAACVVALGQARGRSLAGGLAVALVAAVPLAMAFSGSPPAVDMHRILFALAHPLLLATLLLVLRAAGYRLAWRPIWALQRR